jgi:hypothetical protein
MKQRIVVLAIVFLSVALLGVSRTTTAPDGAASGVTRYEYCQFYGAYFDDGYLDRLGGQGWELVSFNTVGEQRLGSPPNDRLQPESYVLTFKRPLGSGFKNCADSGKK